MKRRFASSKPLRRYSVAIFVLLCVAFGSHMVLTSHAASIPNADLNGDNTVNIFDISFFLTHWQQSGAGTVADLNGDNIVNNYDMSILLSHYGETGVVGGNMIVGLDNGGWGLTGDSDAKSIVDYHRLDADRNEMASVGYNLGLLADMDYSGPYNTGGVSAVNIGNWVSNTLTNYESECGTGAAAVSVCPSIEVLNEPYGSWFWGSSAHSLVNAAAYGNLVVATYQAFHTQYGANSPKILANTFANGCSNGSAVGCADSWWGWVTSAVPNIANYYDGVVIHPYGGGTGYSQATSAQGNRNAVTSAHTATGKPVYITEVGWPTDVGGANTGDSQQWTEAQQADNIYNFIVWARSTSYVDAVYIYDYADDGTGNPTNAYGVAGWPNPESSHKQSWNALKCAAQNKPVNC